LVYVSTIVMVSVPSSQRLVTDHSEKRCWNASYHKMHHISSCLFCIFCTEKIQNLRRAILKENRTGFLETV